MMMEITVGVRVRVGVVIVVRVRVRGCIPVLDDGDDEAIAHEATRGHHVLGLLAHLGWGWGWGWD